MGVNNIAAGGCVTSATYTNNPRPKVYKVNSVSANPRPKVYKVKPIFTCPHHGVHCPNTTWEPPAKPWRVMYPYLNCLDDRPEFDTWSEAYAFARRLRLRPINYYQSLAAY